MIILSTFNCLFNWQFLSTKNIIPRDHRLSHSPLPLGSVDRLLTCKVLFFRLLYFCDKEIFWYSYTKHEFNLHRNIPVVCFWESFWRSSFSIFYEIGLSIHIIWYIATCQDILNFAFSSWSNELRLAQYTTVSTVRPTDVVFLPRAAASVTKFSSSSYFVLNFLLPPSFCFVLWEKAGP